MVTRTKALQVGDLDGTRLLERLTALAASARPEATDEWADVPGNLCVL